MLAAVQAVVEVRAGTEAKVTQRLSAGRVRMKPDLRLTASISATAEQQPRFPQQAGGDERRAAQEGEELLGRR